MKKLINDITTSNARTILAVIMVLGFFALLIMFFFKEIPVGNKDIVTQSGTLLASGMLLVLGYYFGTSKDKTDGDKQDKVTINNPAIKATVSAPDSTQ